MKVHTWEVFTKWVYPGEDDSGGYEFRGNVTTCAKDKAIALKKAMFRYRSFAPIGYLAYRVYWQNESEVEIPAQAPVR